MTSQKKTPSKNHSSAPRRGSRRRARAKKPLPLLLIALIALILLLILAVAARLAIGRARLVRSAENRIPLAAPATALPEQAAVEAPPTAAPTPFIEAMPTLEPVVTEVPQRTPNPNAVELAYLPVVHRATTDAKRIAITVDDCYQMENLKTIVSFAEKSGGKLTLFPVGETVSKAGMADLLRHAAFDLGFEIENHTWSHSRVFRLPDDEMAAEIWKQRAAVNKALGVRYEQHFLRLMGGDGDTDQRIHNYLNQLGYRGIANWSVSGSDCSMKQIKARLSPGQIYLFHCTDPDTKKLAEFIPYAASKGYELVTLNELFGLPANGTSALTDEALPEPRPFRYDYRTIKREEYTWVVYLMQEELRQLGYLTMDGPSTGYYGEQTAAAVTAYQRDHGLSETGEADEATQRSLLGDFIIE